MRDPPALDFEGPTGRPAGRDAITFEDDHLVARAGEREGRCEPRNAAAGDNEPHPSKLSGRTDRGQIDPNHARLRHGCNADANEIPTIVDCIGVLDFELDAA
jgi:hypothetical protein